MYIYIGNISCLVFHAFQLVHVLGSEFDLRFQVIISSKWDQ